MCICRYIYRSLYIYRCTSMYIYTYIDIYMYISISICTTATATSTATTTTTATATTTTTTTTLTTTTTTSINTARTITTPLSTHGHPSSANIRAPPFTTLRTNVESIFSSVQIVSTLRRVFENDKTQPECALIGSSAAGLPQWQAVRTNESQHSCTGRVSVCDHAKDEVLQA